MHSNCVHTRKRVNQINLHNQLLKEIKYIRINGFHYANKYLLATVLFITWNVVGSFAVLTVTSAKMDKTLRSGWWKNTCSWNSKFTTRRNSTAPQSVSQPTDVASIISHTLIIQSSYIIVCLSSQRGASSCCRWRLAINSKTSSHYWVVMKCLRLQQILCYGLNNG
jgi:hypothetical protein